MLTRESNRKHTSYQLLQEKDGKKHEVVIQLDYITFLYTIKPVLSKHLRDNQICLLKTGACLRQVLA